MKAVTSQRELYQRINDSSTFGNERCTIPGCKSPSMMYAGTGLARYHCKYHVQFKARHGSHWCPTYRAAELRPYTSSAKLWIERNRHRSEVVAAILDIQRTLAFAGKVQPAMDLRWLPSSQKARIAFARLREADIEPDRVLSIYLGVAALIEDDFDSHRTKEFLIVQCAKAVHRLASGTHRRWEIENDLGQSTAIVLNAYPRSSGLVLRRIGKAIDGAARDIKQQAISEIIGLKTSICGLHRSHQPGWRSKWDTRTVKKKAGQTDE